MISWSSYKSRLTSRGKTKRERTISREQDNFARKVTSSLSFKEVSIGTIDGETDGSPENMLITSTQQTYAKNIAVLPQHDFDVGSIVYWNKSRWLITKKDVEDEIHKKGGMELCNRQLVWQNPKTKEIHTRWITISKPYFSNLENVGRAEVSTREYKIQVSYDNETALLDLNKRFILEIVNDNAKTYRITSIDPNTVRYSIDNKISGFLIINIEQDQFNPNTDRADLMIADYINKKSPDPIPSGSYLEFQYENSPTVKQGNSRYTDFVAVIYDSNGIAVPGAVANINYDVIADFQNLIFVEYEVGRIRIRVDKKVPVGTQIRLEANYQQITTELYIKVVGIY